ncbi:MAG TPA: SRPBCC domain-containing protein [Flavisolibacter sp.]|nr:SRPBCC domain-containing protein [Flavisolibacter sp.]
MLQDLTASGSIVINASPSKVWNVLTNPALIKEYLFGTETITDWKAGSEIIFQGDYQGHKYRDKGVIRQNILNKLISYTYWSGFSGLEDKPENYSLVTYTITSKSNDQSEFTWTQKGFANEGSFKHSESGMQGLLQQIKEIAER